MVTNFLRKFKSSIFYLESQNTDKLIIGVQYLDLRSNDIETDYYLQIKMDDTSRVIVGNRILESRSKTYLGGAVRLELTSDVGGYVSLIAGRGLQELQLGANYKLTNTSDVNINFSAISSYPPSIGMGLSCKF